MKTAETKMTVSELKEALKASSAKVRLHFTAKGNPAWRSVYRYGKKDHEIGYCRISKREANERLAEFGLTANLVIEIGKAKAEAEAAQCRQLCIAQMGAVLAKFAKAENETVNSDGATEIGDDTVKFFNGKFFSVFSHKYHGAIVDAGCLHYCVFNDDDIEVYDVRGHEVSYDEFMQIMAQRAEHLPDEP